MSAQKRPDKRVTRYLQWYTWRLDGRPEDRILRGLKDQKLGEFGTLAALHKQLANDGFPVCPVCGETPAGPRHCKTPRGRRPGPHDGEVVKLPSAADAIPLFEGVIGSRSEEEPVYGFAFGLHYLCESLTHLEEELHGKRFVSNIVLRPDSEPPFEGTLRREDYSEEDWIGICERFSQHPGSSEFAYGDTPEAPAMVAQGASSRSPWKGLTVLIGAYLLLEGRPVEDLLDVLHPDPSRLDKEKLKKTVDKLKLSADQVARLVRGGIVDPGSPTEGLSDEELELAYRITEMKEEGLLYDQIYDLARDRGWEHSLQDIKDLGKHNLQRPDYRSPAP